MSVDTLHPPLRLGSLRFHSAPALVLTVVVIVLCALPILFIGEEPSISVPELPWHQWFGISEEARAKYGPLGGPFTHSSLLLLGGTVAFCGALLSFARSTVRRSALTSVVSIALFWAAFVSITQVITAENSFIFDREMVGYIAFTGFVMRAIVALLLTLGGGLLLLPRGGRFLDRTRALFSLFFLFGVLSILFVWLANSLELPQTIFADRVIKRPYDLPVLVLLGLCNIVIFPRLHGEYQSYFSFALWLSTVPLVAAQLYLIFGSSLIFDDSFNIAYGIQLMAFFILFGGLVWDYARTTREEKHLLEVVQSREARFRAMFDSAFDGIIAVGEQGRVEMWSPAATELLGYEAEEAVGQEVVELLIPPDLQGQFRAHVERALARESDEQAPEEGPLELTMKHQQGTTIDVMATIDGFSDDEFWLYTLVIKDLTERKRMEQRLVQMDRMITIGTLAAGVGHEIKNPLTFVVNHLELALESLSEDQVDQHQLKGDLMAAQVGAERIYRIMKDLKMMSGFQIEPLQRVCAVEAVEMALRMTRYQIQGRAILKEEFEQDIAVMADEGRLTQVIINLLLNASHAMPSRPRDENMIILRLFKTAGQAILEVEDNGSGIPKSLQEHIFEPFFTTKARGEGTGLGLSLSRQIIRSFHGDLTLESTLNKGTVFRITLPLLDHS